MPASAPDSSSIISSGSATKLFSAYRKKGRPVRVIAIGAENKPVERADRVLQLWASAEPGKVIEGLTVKQEIRAISDAIDHRDMEFLGKYGGLIQAGERYKELLKLPEAELTEGVSINGYSTYRATRFADPICRANLGCFWGHLTKREKSYAKSHPNGRSWPTTALFPALSCSVQLRYTLA